MLTLINQLLPLMEGKFVVKSKDGVERRFKNADSDEAKAWKTTVAKKSAAPKAKKYSEEWWDEQDARVKPWSKIEHLDSDELSGMSEFKDRMPDDWTFGKAYSKVVDGVDVAGRVVHLMYMYTKDDDMGLDGDTEHTQNIGVLRDVKNPEKFVFDGYK